MQNIPLFRNFLLESVVTIKLSYYSEVCAPNLTLWWSCHNTPLTLWHGALQPVARYPPRKPRGFWIPSKKEWRRKNKNTMTFPLPQLWGWEDSSSCTFTVGNTGLSAQYRVPKWMRRMWIWSFNGFWCGLYDRIGNKDVYRHPRSHVCLGTMDVYSFFFSNSVAEEKGRNPQVFAQNSAVDGL